MRVLICLGLCIALAVPALGASFTFTPGGTQVSAGGIGDGGNTVLPFFYGGPDFAPNYLWLTGDLTEANAGSITFGSEARVQATAPNGATFVSSSWISTANFSGTINVPLSYQGTGGFAGSTATGNWLFEFYESYDDDTGADALWTNLVLELSDSMPPPAAADLGAIVDTGADPDLVVVDFLDQEEIDWFTFTVPSDVLAVDGRYFQIDTVGSTFDTEIGLFAADGSLIASNDDAGGYGLQSLLRFGQGGGDDLLAGQYYLALGGFNTFFAGGFSADGGSSAGEYVLNFGTNVNVPEPGSLVLLGLGGLFLGGMIRRRKSRV